MTLFLLAKFNIIIQHKTMDKYFFLGYFFLPQTSYLKQHVIIK